MPVVGGRHYSYSARGRKAARKARRKQKSKHRNGRKKARRSKGLVAAFESLLNGAVKW